MGFNLSGYSVSYSEKNVNLKTTLVNNFQYKNNKRPMRYLWTLTFCWAMFSTLTIGQNANLAPIHPVKIDGKWGFIDNNAQLVVEPEYDAYNYQNGYMVIEKDKLVGALNAQGILVVPPKYKRLRPLGVDIFAVVIDSLETVIDARGDRLLQAEYQYIEIMNPEYFVVRQDSFWGIHKRGGHQVVLPIYHQIKSINKFGGFFVPHNKEKNQLLVGLMDTSGQLILPIQYEAVGVINDSLFAFKENGYWGIANDKKAVVVEAKWTRSKVLSNNFVVLYPEKGKGQPALFSCIEGKMIPFDEEEEYVNFTPLNSSYILAHKRYYVGLLDSLGNKILDPEYYRIRRYKSPDLLEVQKAGWGLYSISRDSVVLPAVYNDISALKNGTAIATLQRKKGVVNERGELALACNYDRVLVAEGIIKAYLKRKLTVFRINAAGKAELQTSYKNVRTIRIVGGKRKRRSALGRISNTAVDLYRVGSYRWRHSGRLWGIYDADNGRFVIPPTYRNIYPIPKSNITVVVSDKQLITKDLKLYTGFSKDSLYALGIFDHRLLRLTTPLNFAGIRTSDFKNGNSTAAFIGLDGSFGLVHRSGKIVTQGATYRYIGYFSEGVARTCINGKPLSLIQKGFKGNPAIRWISGLLDEFRMAFIGYKPVLRGFLHVENGDWGYLDTLGKMTIPPQYVYAVDMNEGRAVNRKKGGWGMIDSAGNTRIDFQYLEIKSFGNGLYKLKTKNKNIVSLDAFGNAVYNRYERQGQYVEGLCRVAQRDSSTQRMQWGYINTDGAVTIPFRYLETKDFYEGWAAVKDSVGWHFIDKEGKEQLRLHKAIKDVGNFHSDLAWVKAGSRYGFINRDGKFVLKPKYSKVSDFTHEVALVVHKGAAMVVDKQGQIVVEAGRYGVIRPFDENGLAVVQRRGRRLVGLIDTYGKEVVTPIYDQIGAFKQGFAKIRQLGKFGYINKQGKVIVRPKYEKTGEPTEGLIAVSKIGIGDWQYIDYEGNIAIPQKFVKAQDFHKGFAVVTILDKDKQKRTALIDKTGKFHYISTADKKLVHYSENRRGIAFRPISTDSNTITTSITRYYFTDNNNQKLFDQSFYKIFPFENDLAFVIHSNYHWGAINSRGFKIIAPKYIRLIRQPDGTIRGRTKFLYGLCNRAGDYVQPVILDKIEQLRSNFYQVERDGQVGYIDMNGEWVWKMEE